MSNIPARPRRVLRAVAVALVVLVLATVGVGLVGNDLRLTQRHVRIDGPLGGLDGVLTLPPSGDVRGLVVMVHGDGAVEATQGGLYAPWFEAAADEGFATLSWSKPGVGDSDGGWLEQSMVDRGAEVDAALDWAVEQPEISTDTVVLWGASQAGWVLPAVVAERDDVAGVVAVGTAVNWLRQGRFHLESGLADAGADDAERAAAIATSDRTIEMLEQGATWETYVANTDEAEPMTRERWAFVLENFRSDASEDLREAAARELPWLLMVGEEDRNVDVDETARVYRSLLGEDLEVAAFEAPHSLARPIAESSGLVGSVIAVLWPRALLAPGVLDTYRTFLAARG